MLQEMAEAGAKVLNAQAVEWARRAKITLHARRTSDPLDAGGRPPRETIAREERREERDGLGRAARAVVGLDRIVRLRARASELGELASACAELAIPLVYVAVAGDSAFAAVPLLNVPDWDRRRSELEARLGNAVVLASGGAIVSVVGDGLTTVASGLPRFLAALARVGLSGMPDAVVAGPLRIAACIDALHLEAAQRELHTEFVGPRPEGALH